MPGAGSPTQGGGKDLKERYSHARPKAAEKIIRCSAPGGAEPLDFEEQCYRDQEVWAQSSSRTRPKTLLNEHSIEP